MLLPLVEHKSSWLISQLSQWLYPFTWLLPHCHITYTSYRSAESDLIDVSAPLQAYARIHFHEMKRELIKIDNDNNIIWRHKNWAITLLHTKILSSGGARGLCVNKSSILLPIKTSAIERWRSRDPFFLWLYQTQSNEDPIRAETTKVSWSV